MNPNLSADRALWTVRNLPSTSAEAVSWRSTIVRGQGLTLSCESSPQAGPSSVCRFAATDKSRSHLGLTRAARMCGYSSTCALARPASGTAEVESTKRFATLAARLALAGYQLHAVLEADSNVSAYLVSRWNLARELDCIDAVERFADEVASRA